MGVGFPFGRLPAARFGIEADIIKRKGKQMPTMEIVRAWKDEEYRDTLTAEQLAQLPEHPSGLIEFGEPELEDESVFGPQAGGCKFYTKTTNTGHCTTHTGPCK
jgi:mersacidin/lichenicidin family type 2 lantibiotic